MVVGVCEVKLGIRWAGSLKEKRAVIRSVTDRIKAKFNVSIAEVDEQDNKKIIVLGVACVANDAKVVESIIDKVINFIIEQYIEVEIIEINRERIVY